MKRLIFSLLVTLTGFAFAQTYNMSNAPISTCSGTFYDDGGSGANYNDANGYTETFTSSTGDRLSFNFTYFSTYAATDYLRIYDGPTTAYPLIGTYFQGGSPGTVTSTGTSLTFQWVTNNNNSSAGGWIANISCTTPALTDYPMNTGTVTACSGVFYDNGGATANYPNNESRVQTFCSGTSDMLQFNFNNTAFTLSTNDTLFVYDGASTSAPPLATYVAGSYAGTLTSSGTCLTFKFVSDGTTNSQGWQAQFNCVSVAPSANNYNMSSGVRYVCDGSFYDDGGSGGNYNDAMSRTQTFTSYNGNRISFNFSYFSTYNVNDYLRIYDGPTTAYPLIGTYLQGGSPGTITSTGTSLTFQWIVNNGGTSAGGWAADISCSTPTLTVYPMNTGTVTACSGVFYDNGGATANYPNNDNRVQTFCSGTTDMLQFNFNNTAFTLSANDTLFVYDGASTSAPPLATYVAGSYAETLTSSGTCLTFKFISDGTTNSQGWQAQFNCVSVAPSANNYNMSSGVRYVCDGSFYDDGGANGNYNDAMSRTQTFTSYNGNRISFNFTYFSTYNVNDYLRIYDGPTTAYPLIGTYLQGGSPGTITSTGTSLTFQWIVNNSATSAGGWAADISCSTPTLTVYPMNTGTVTACSGVFYDNGGATANYPNNDNRVQTFCSGTTDMLQFNFNNTAFTLSANDTLFVYDGASTSSSPLATYVAGSYAETLTSSGTCLTFKFVSDGTTNSQGWQAQFNCVSVAPSANNYNMSSGVRYVCDGSFYDDGGSGGNYNDAMSRTQTFTSYNGNRISFNFTYFSTYNVNDYLRIYDGPTTAYPLIGTYLQGGSPGTITSTGTSLTFQWIVNNSATSAGGWAADISCSTPTLAVYPMNTGTVTACSGVFYDNGGATANYPNNENREQTFCSGNGDFIQFTFNNNAYTLSGNDSLFVYDGSNSSAQPLAVYVAGSYVETITSSGTCLTFKFKSDGTTNSQGWQATFTCTPVAPSQPVFNISAGIRYTCDAMFYDDGGAGANYNDAADHVQTFVSTGGCGLRATFTAFATYSTADYLRVYDGMSTASPLIGTWSGGTSPGIVQSSGTALTFEWITNSGGTSAAGWTAAFSCPGQTAPPVVSNNGPVCEGDSILFSMNAIPGATYTWSGPNGFSSSSQNPFVINSTASDAGTYSVTATVAGCSSNQTISSVSVNPVPAQPVLSNDGPVCSGGNINLSCATVAGAAYQWSGPNGFNTSAQNPAITNISTAGSGNYIASITVNGCSSQDTTTVIVNATPAAPSVSSDSPVCEGSGLNLTANGTGATYSWSGPNGFTSSTQNPSLVNITLNEGGTYSVTTTSAAGCTSAVSTTSVVVVAAPTVPTTGSNAPVCEGGTISLTANSTGTSYSWSGPNGFTSSNQNPSIGNADALTDGTYSVVAITTGCPPSAPATVSVSVIPAPAAPVITAGSNITFCSGGSVTLTSSSAIGYSWNTSEATQSIIVTTGGTYIVTITDANGCTNSGSIMVTVNPLPNAFAGNDLSICSGDSVTLGASGGVNYSWSPGISLADSTISNPSAGPAATTDYTVTVTDANGCIASDVVQVFISPCLGLDEIENNLGLNVFPNPLTSSTTVSYEVKERSLLNISVYNEVGEKVAELANAIQEAGRYETRWNAETVSEGIYLLVIRSGENVRSVKVNVIR